MPKNIVILLRKVLNTQNLELLDVYRFKDSDYIRVRDKFTGKIYIHKLKMQLRQVTSLDELKIIVEEILRQES